MDFNPDAHTLFMVEQGVDLCNPKIVFIAELLLDTENTVLFKKNIFTLLD